MLLTILARRVEPRLDLLKVMLRPETESAAAFVTWAWRFLLVHLIFRYTKGFLSSQDIRWDLMVCLALMLAALGSSLVNTSRAVSFSKFAAATSVVIEMAGQFPINPNHTCLEALAVCLFILTDFESADQRELLVAMGRWTITIIMLHSGIQKILYGEYFNGMYFATMVADDRFQAFFKLVLPAEEFARLLEKMQTRSEGPFFFESAVGTLISNSVYAIELLVGILLLKAKTRMLGAVLGLSMLVAIEVVAVEFTFGLIALNLLMLFFPVSWRFRVAVVSCAAYICLLALQWSVGPDKFLFV